MHASCLASVCSLLSSVSQPQTRTNTTGVIAAKLSSLMRREPKKKKKKVSTVVTLKGLGCWILGWVLEGRATLLDERAPVERGDHSPWPVARGSISRFDSIKAFMDFQSRRYSGDGFWPSGEKNRPVLGVTVQGNRGSKK